MKWNDILKRIEDNRLNSEMIKPHYENFSIVNISNWVLKNFDLEVYHNPYPINSEKKDHVILIIIDAMSYWIYKKILSSFDLKILSEHSFFPATSVFPSTTSTALTSFFTALEPQEHGILGFLLYLKEVASITNMIYLSPPNAIGKDVYANFLVSKLLDVPTIFDLLEKNGVKTMLFMHSDITNSGLSRIHTKGGNIRGYKTEVEACWMIYEHIKELEEKNLKSFTVLYYAHPDGIGHRYGVLDYRYREQIYWFLKILERNLVSKINSRLKEKVTLVITADHGMIDTPIQNEVHIFKNEKLTFNMILPPGGEMRMMYFYTKNKEKFKKDFIEEYSDKGLILDIDKAIEEKLFGSNSTVASKYKNRIGDLVMISKKNHNFIYKYSDKDVHLKGSHGGMSFYEMIVPVVVI